MFLRALETGFRVLGKEFVINDKFQDHSVEKRKCRGSEIIFYCLGYMGELRVCEYCARVVVTYLPQGLSTSDSQQGETKEELSVRDQPVKNVATVSAGKNTVLYVFQLTLIYYLFLTLQDLCFGWGNPHRHLEIRRDLRIIQRKMVVLLLHQTNFRLSSLL